MDWFHFTSKCFIGDVKEHSNDTLLKWLLFSAGLRQTGESIIIDLASGEILHSSYKYGQKYIVLESVFFSLFYIKMPCLPRLSIVWQWLQLQKLLFLHNTQMWGGPQESASCSVRKEDTMCRNYVGIFLQINWYFHAYFYATQTKSSLNQTQEITKWQKEIHFYSTLISSQDAVLKEYKSFRR